MKLPSLPDRIRSFLAPQPAVHPQYNASFLIEARALLRQSLEEIELLRDLASPVWPEERDE